MQYFRCVFTLLHTLVSDHVFICLVVLLCKIVTDPFNSCVQENGREKVRTRMIWVCVMYMPFFSWETVDCCYGNDFSILLQLLVWAIYRGSASTLWQLQGGCEAYIQRCAIRCIWQSKIFQALLKKSWVQLGPYGMHIDGVLILIWKFLGTLLFVL